MRNRKKALAMALVLVFVMTSIAMAVNTGGARLTVSTEIRNGQVAATVYLEGGEGITNGRICVAYDTKAATLEAVQVLMPCSVSSVNSETARETLAWVGSSLSGEKTAALQLTFRLTGEGDLALTVTAPETYAGKTAVEVAGASAAVVFNPFTDIDGHWAKSDILNAYHAGLFRGVTDTTFAPEGELTRAMFVTTLYRMEGEPTVNGSAKFTDVAEGSYYEKAVVWAAEAAITDGVGNGKFAPDLDITRQEMVTMLYRYAATRNKIGTAGGKLENFSDGSAVSSWAQEAMGWAVKENLLKGYPDGTLRPDLNVTRAQAAAILCRFLEI